MHKILDAVLNYDEMSGEALKAKVGFAFSAIKYVPDMPDDYQVSFSFIKWNGDIEIQMCLSNPPAKFLVDPDVMNINDIPFENIARYMRHGEVLNIVVKKMEG